MNKKVKIWMSIEIDIGPSNYLLSNKWVISKNNILETIFKSVCHLVISSDISCRVGKGMDKHKT